MTAAAQAAAAQAEQALPPRGGDEGQVESLGGGAFKLPDGTIAYTHERAAIEYEKIRAPEYSASDIVLLLLSAQDGPVVGRTLLFKELFLFEREIFGGEDAEDCMFVPYHYGPYSFYLALKIREMERQGLIEVGRQGGTPAYSLTPRGRKKAEARRRAVPGGLLARMAELRKGLDQHGSSRILEAVYKRARYAEYVARSRVAHRYRAITWGRGA